MDSAELFKQLVYLYRKAREPKFYHPNIKRGKSHTMASQVEDLFAFYLSINLTKDYKFFVDQALNFGKRQFNPDISIIDNGTLIHSLDIKTDLGWNRDGFTEFCGNKEKNIKEFFGVELSVTDGVTKKKFKINTPSKFHYHVVILSGTNINKEKLNKHLYAVSKLKYVHTYVLFPNEHPNYYGNDVEQFINSVTINKKDFKRLEEALTRHST